jgi:hypothetical protein
MPATYEPIETKTIGTAVASVTFSSIPATYTDLVLVMSGTTSSGGADSSSIQFNGDTTTNYSWTNVQGSGTSTASGGQSNYSAFGGGLVSSSEVTNTIYQVFNYTNTTTFKTILSKGNIAGTLVRASVGLWRKTPEAITSITLKNDSAQNFSIGYTFTLYGVKAA